MNPLNTPVYDLFYHLNTLNGLLFTLENQLNNFEKFYKDSISKTSFDISNIFSGTSLVIRDLTEWPEGGWARYYPSGKFSSKGEEYFELIRVLLARESAWTVSQAYEAFEIFLKDLSSTLLFKNQQMAETKKVKKFKSDSRSNNMAQNCIIFWRKYLDYHYKTNTKKLKLLRKICPDISKGETENNRVVDLTDWFIVVEEIRHSATHSNFVIKTSRMKNWSKAKREMLKKYFPGINIEQGYRLNITSENAKYCLKLFSEYSFQIYKFLSISRGYDWNILKKKEEK
ncbi:MAG: hypothetical protein KAU01_03860 [Candidatus Cloacimonetes bacterium]|nr:hypothetical protein [Candidatus Cloacimonadota bacterium]